MTPKDYLILAETERLLMPYLTTGEDVKPLARELFEKAKAGAKTRFGEDMYSESKRESDESGNPDTEIQMNGIQHFL